MTPDTDGGYANWVRTKATDEQIIGMRNQRDALRREVERLREENMDTRGIAASVAQENARMRAYMSVRVVLNKDKDTQPVSILDQYEHAVANGFFVDDRR